MSCSLEIATWPREEEKELEWIEFFAGHANATWMVRSYGFHAARVDMLYHKGSCKREKSMNLLTDSGMALLLCLTRLAFDALHCVCDSIVKLWDLCNICSCSALLRLAIYLILRGKPDKLVAHFGLKCSTWTPVNCATSSRSPCSSIGNLDFQSVKEGNALGSRLLCCINRTSSDAKLRRG